MRLLYPKPLLPIGVLKPAEFETKIFKTRNSCSSVTDPSNIKSLSLYNAPYYLHILQFDPFLLLFG